ncbi:MAG: chemotaxis protein CheB [Syntrophobacteraceae bacterium]
MARRNRGEIPASGAPEIPMANESQQTPSSSESFPIVGIGASAGGVSAFEAFFSGMPADTEPGMAFVLVQHLSPDHKSILTDLIRRYTRMQVYEVEDGMEVRPNCAYIIPPGHDMAFLGGSLQLLKPSAPRGQRLPIDFFFRSLAQDLRERAIGIVLSGTGSDGTLGVRAIKGEGGMVMVQDPEFTEYDGMPRSAIATGMVDYLLPPAKMPEQLIAYVAHAFLKGARPAPIPPAKAESAIKKIFVLLRANTGHDFSQYKLSTTQRRIERRMALHQIEGMDGYVRYLQQTPSEVDALFRDMLIGVTSFFRDPAAFKALETEIVPKLFADKSPDSSIRVWSPGCATGEEAYSLAILLAEHQEVLKRRFRIQIFATDIDSQAISTARPGIYPASIAADVSSERLARFFSAEADGSTVRIHKAVRDLLVFSEQDVIKDPPFSKLDLICCRNLLIYMNADLQKKLIPLFHYALNPGGFLLLGTSESVGEFGDLFATVDRKNKIFQRRRDMHSNRYGGLITFLPPMPAPDVAAPAGRGAVGAPGKVSLRDLTERALLMQAVPSAALVSGSGDILYLHGRTGLYLEPTPGESGVNNILRMAREGLRRDLSVALHRAAASRQIARAANLRVRTNGDSITANLTVTPVGIGLAKNQETPLYLVVFEQVQQCAYEDEASFHKVSEDGAGAPEADVDSRIAALEQQLRAKEDYLQTANEELETANEELKSSNEEMQSVNEELQSTNEELETSKEELQSVNEELATVNSELQTKVVDLTRANNDMNNLLAGTGIGTIFVDHGLNILRFTPAATKVINLIQADIGRPLDHIVSNLIGYDRLAEDIRSVLDTLIPKEVEVRSKTDAWYVMRVLPYRTLENVIEGAVVTFVDITSLKQAQEELRERVGLHIYKAFVTASADVVYRMSADWSEMRHLHGRDFMTDTDGPSSTWLEKYIHPDDQELVKQAIRRAIRDRNIFELEHRVIRLDGSAGWAFSRAVPILDDNGEIVEWLGTARDVTASREAEMRAQEGTNCAAGKPFTKE